MIATQENNTSSAPSVCVSHISAFRYFMWSSNDKRLCWPVEPASNLQIPPERSPSAAEAKQFIDELGVGFGELHILVSSKSARRWSHGITPHYTSENYSPQSFWQIDYSGADVYITSPELTFLQLASELDFIDLVAAGNALCSAFRYDPLAVGGVINRYDCGEKPWTTPRQLEAFAARHPSVHGSKCALRALRYVYPGSLSPKESGIAMACGMPYKLGGYSLGSIKMNQKISIFIDKDLQGRRWYQDRIPDIVITARGVDGLTHVTGVDYDPWSTHGSEDRIASDAIRRNQIATVDSLNHITITTPQVMNYALFDSCMNEIRRTLHVRKGPRMGSSLSEESRRLKRAQAEKHHMELWEQVIRSSRPFGAAVNRFTR